MTKFYYFTFHVEVPSKGWVADDYSCIETAGSYFPVCDIRRWARQEFGNDCKFLVTNVVRIDDKDFKQLVSDIENNVD